MSESSTQVGIARARAGAVIGRSADPREEDIRAALATVMDPELPMLSIVDLGMVGEVEVGPPIVVELLPTFVGCPALDLIRTTVELRLASFGRPVSVVTSFAVPWSSERITTAGREALAAAGIGPPAELSDMRCPHCGSSRVVVDNLFGPTQCRSIHYCRECRQPFEAVKSI